MHQLNLGGKCVFVDISVQSSLFVTKELEYRGEASLLISKFFVVTEFELYKK